MREDRELGSVIVNYLSQMQKVRDSDMIDLLGNHLLPPPFPSCTPASFPPSTISPSSPPLLAIKFPTPSADPESPTPAVPLPAPPEPAPPPPGGAVFAGPLRSPLVLFFPTIP
jgi:hypothetical protein